MRQNDSSALIKPALRIGTAGLFSLLGIPLGTLTGAVIGGLLEPVFGEALSYFSRSATEKLIERAGEAFLGQSGGSLVERLRRSRPNLESIYREAFRISLDRIHKGAENGYDDWFANWGTSLKAQVGLDLEEIQPGQIEPEKFDGRFRSAMERLDAQGASIEAKSTSTKLSIRPAPEPLLDELKTRLPGHFPEVFRDLIVQREQVEAWNEAELVFRDLLAAAIARIDNAVANVDQKTEALPRMENMLAELLGRKAGTDQTPEGTSNALVSWPELAEKICQLLKEDRTDPTAQLVGKIEAERVVVAGTINTKDFNL
jgi:hypothetical protein